MDSSQVIIGAPGSGKTQYLIDRADYLVKSLSLHPDRVRFLTPTRSGATTLRDRVSMRLSRATAGPFVKSVASLAFSLVSADHLRQGLPVPTLRSGADIDDDIRELLRDGHSPFDGFLGDDVIATETFRTELRELMARVIEHGYTADDLHRWGGEYGRGEWVRSAEFMVSYQEAIARARPHSFDAAELLERALAVVDNGLPGEWAELAVVLVDDSHDMPASARRLLIALSRAGVSVIAVGDPDSAGQTFRGSNPDGPALLADALGVQPHYLQRVFRHGPAITGVVSGLAGRLGAARAGQQRQGESVAEDADLPVSHLLSASSLEEDRHLARLVSGIIDTRGLSPDQVAIISRQSGALTGVARALAQLGIPSHRATRSPLSSQPAARELLWWVQAAVDPDVITEDHAHDMLIGLYGRWSALDVRRFTTWVRLADRESGATRLPRTAIRDLVVGADLFVDAPAAIATRIDRIRRLVGAIRDTGADSPVEQVMRSAWLAVGVEETWRVEATEGGEGARAASAHLDAVVALMETVARADSSTSAVSAAFFAARVLGQDVAEDVVVQEPLSPSVWLGTPSSAAGREWEVVILHGVNDGVWPNLRVRGSLLGAPLINHVAAGVDPLEIDQRRIVVDDEIRMAILAASRARAELVISAVSSEDTAPSPLFPLLTAGSVERVVAGQRAGSVAEQVAQLRKTLVGGGPPDSLDNAAAELAHLAGRGVWSADPANWWGVLPPTTTEPLFSDSVPRLSPSKVGDVESSPLLWLLDTIAPEPLPPVVGAGAIVHRALEENPWGPLEAMVDVVNASWSEIPFESAWVSEAKRLDALRQLAALVEYLQDQKAEGVELVGSELRFLLSVPGADISGVMDRVVVREDGRYQVVDLKTGRYKTDSQVVDDPQLLSYQLAITTPGAVEGVGENASSAGAYLLYVSSGVRGKTYRLAQQQPLDDATREAFLDRLGQVAAVVSSHQFSVGEAGVRVPGQAPKHRWHLIGQVCGD